jgi:hypothetical protein
MLRRAKESSVWCKRLRLQEGLIFPIILVKLGSRDSDSSGRMAWELAQEVEEADDLAVAFVKGIRLAGSVHIEDGCESRLIRRLGIPPAREHPVSQPLLGAAYSLRVRGAGQVGG